MGAAHSRQSTTDELAPPLEGVARKIRTTPPELHSRACQHVWRLHRHGPEAAERTGRSAITKGRLLPRRGFGTARIPESRRMATVVKMVHVVVAKCSRCSSSHLTCSHFTNRDRISSRPSVLNYPPGQLERCSPIRHTESRVARSDAIWNLATRASDDLEGSARFTRAVERLRHAIALCGGPRSLDKVRPRRWTLNGSSGRTGRLHQSDKRTSGRTYGDCIDTAQTLQSERGCPSSRQTACNEDVVSPWNGFLVRAEVRWS